MNRQEQNRSREFQAGIDRITQAFDHEEGDASPALHRAVVAYTSHRFSNREPNVDVPINLAPYLDKVALHAYKITDADVAKLQEIGYSDDAIFEVTVGGAFGAGMATWQTGLQAIDTFFDAANEEGREESREEPHAT